MRRVRTHIIAAYSIALVFGPALWPVPGHAADERVGITGIGSGYSPRSVTINPGESVTWRNRDPNAPHNAVCGDACPQVFATPRALEAGDEATIVLRYSGRYNYYCSLHPSMQGVVVVTGSVQAPPATSRPRSPSNTSTTTDAATPAAPADDTTTTAGDAAAAPVPAPAPAINYALPELTLPEPTLTVVTRGGAGTSAWFLVPAGLLAALAALLCWRAWAPRREAGEQ